MNPSTALRKHVSMTQVSIAQQMRSGVAKIPQQLRADLEMELDKFQGARETFRLSFAATQQALFLDTQVLHTVVDAYLAMLWPVADVIYKSVALFNTGDQAPWEQVQQELLPTIGLDMAIRVYRSKYDRREAGQKKSPSEKKRFAENLGLPYTRNQQGRWTPSLGWQPQLPIRHAEDLCLTLTGMNGLLAFVDLDETTRETESFRFRPMKLAGVDPMLPQFFVLDQIYPHSKEHLLQIEQCGFAITFLSTTGSSDPELDQPTYSANFDQLSNWDIMSLERRLILRPAYSKQQKRKGPDWKAQIILQEITRRWPMVVLLADDREDIRNRVRELWQNEGIGGPGPLLQVASSLSEAVQRATNIKMFIQQ